MNMPPLIPEPRFAGFTIQSVNYGGNKKPEVIFCCHEEYSVAMAHGYAKATGKPMAAITHNIVGLQHASMAIFNAWCDRVPVIVLGGTGPMDTTRRRPRIDWQHTALVQGNIWCAIMSSGTTSPSASRVYRTPLSAAIALPRPNRKPLSISAMTRTYRKMN